MRRFNSQSLILLWVTLFVLYLAGVPLLMLLYGSIRSAPIGEPGATYTIQNYVNAYFDKEFYLVLLNSLYYGIGNLHRILLYSYISTVLSIMAFDLWEGGQYTYVCALGVLMVLLLIAMAFTARTVGAKVGIAA